MHRRFFSESPLILAQSIALFATWTEYYTRRMKCENLEFHLAFVWPTSNPANRLLMLLGVLSFFSLHMNTSFSSIFIRSRQAKGFISMLFMRLFFPCCSSARFFSSHSVLQIYYSDCASWNVHRRHLFRICRTQRAVSHTFTPNVKHIYILSLSLCCQ